MQFDATLNLAWAVLGLFALVATVRVALRQRSLNSAPRWLLIVGLIVTALFPYISASDDILRLGNTEHSFNLAAAAHSASNDRAAISLAADSRRQSQNGERHQADDLLRLYETLDTPLVCRLVAITFYFLLISVIAALTCARATCVAPDVAGRSPPFAFAA